MSDPIDVVRSSPEQSIAREITRVFHDGDLRVGEPFHHAGDGYAVTIEVRPHRRAGLLIHQVWLTTRDALVRASLQRVVCWGWKCVAQGWLMGPLDRPDGSRAMKIARRRLGRRYRLTASAADAGGVHDVPLPRGPEPVRVRRHEGNWVALDPWRVEWTRHGWGAVQEPAFIATSSRPICVRQRQVCGVYSLQEMRMAGSTGGRWQTLHEHGVRWAPTPDEPGRWHVFCPLEEAPFGLVRCTVRGTGDGCVHTLFPLRRAADCWKGDIYPEPGASWQQVVIEPVGPALLEEWARREPRRLVEQLQELLGDFGPRCVGPTGPERYSDLWCPLLASLQGNLGTARNEPRPSGSGEAPL